MTAVPGKLLLLLLLILPTTFMIVGTGGPTLVQADDADIVEGEDEEADGAVEDEDEGEVEEEGTDAAQTEQTGEEEEEAEAEDQLKPSPDADTSLLFIQPARANDFPVNSPVRMIVGFMNKGKVDFMVESMDAALRYPQDYSFYIYNFTAVKYNRAVEPNREASFEYGFTPHEQFQGRPFGLTINVNYKDVDGNIFQDAVFNETVNIAEPDEGLDGETFFLYVVLAALVVLALVGIQQLLSSFGKRSKPKQVVEMGTQNNSDIDYDWIPKETLQSKNSPGRSPKTSPRARRSKRSTGSDE